MTEPVPVPLTANQEAALVVLNRMGVPELDHTDALAATEDVVNIFHPYEGFAVTAEWECAAELVATFQVVTGNSGAGLRQVGAIARAAYKLKRFDADV